MVCYHNSPNELQQLFDSVIIALGSLKQEYSLEPIVFNVIDNAESGGLEAGFLAPLEQLGATVGLSFRLIQGHGNVGYGRAHNLAVAGLSSDYHLMLNPDVILNPDALTIGIDYLQEHSSTVLAAPMAIGPDGRQQYLCKRHPSIVTLLVRGFLPQSMRWPFAARLARYEMQDLSASEPTASVPIASGCYMLCRTQPLLEAGGFNESYFLYFEDFDLSLRMGKLGEIAYLPAMKISHGGGNAAKKGIKHIALFFRSGLRFFNTHGWVWFG